MTSLCIRLLPAFLLAPVTCVAQAGDAATSTAPALTTSATLTLASQYVSRGMRQTWGRPALQAGFDAVHASGWSAGA